jgi:hypothetical protein
MRVSSGASAEADVLDTTAHGLAGRSGVSPSRIAFIGSSAVARGLGRGADVALLTVDDWRAVVDEALPDLLLLQVAAPMEGGWWDASGSIGGAPSLEAVTAWAAARGVPSVCWVTEPAERAGRFVSLLGLCDRVFCVDPEAAVHVDAADAGERYAGELQLATDPPEPEISRQLRSGVVYAGGWSSAWSDRSRRMLATLLSAAEPHGLTLLQRPGDPNDWSAVHVG